MNYLGFRENLREQWVQKCWFWTMEHVMPKLAFQQKHNRGKYSFKNRTAQFFFVHNPNRSVLLCLIMIVNGSCCSLSRIIPNCIMKAKSERRRPFVGDQIEDCRDASGLFYILPFQKVRATHMCYVILGL